MKQLLYYIGIFAGCLVVLTSCYEDKGNYEYHELEEVTIDTAGTGMLAEYAIMRYDSLRIAPNIYFEGALVTDESLAPLDYMWTIYSATTGVGANQVIDTIGYHSVLDTVITRTGGAYYVQLAVTNRHDGIRQFYRTMVTVSEVFDGGWMVFYERADKPGHSDLALIYKDAVVSEESKHMRFLLFAPALSLVNLLCGKDSDFDPRIDFFLLLLIRPALDVGNEESGDDRTDECEYDFNNGSDVHV